MATNTKWKSTIGDWDSSEQLPRFRPQMGRASKCATFVRSRRLCLRLSRHAQHNRQEPCRLQEMVYCATTVGKHRDLLGLQHRDLRLEAPVAYCHGSGRSPTDLQP